MFSQLSPVDMFTKLQDFFDLRDRDIYDIRGEGKVSHEDYREWLTPYDREDMLKECLARLLYIM